MWQLFCVTGQVDFFNVKVTYALIRFQVNIYVSSAKVIRSIVINFTFCTEKFIEFDSYHYFRTLFCLIFSIKYWIFGFHSMSFARGLSFSFLVPIPFVIKKSIWSCIFFGSVGSSVGLLLNRN